MNPEEKRETERKLEALEAEINPTSPLAIEPPGQPIEPSNQFSWKEVLSRLTEGFNDLPTPGKAIAVVVAIGIAFSLLRTVLQLVTALISLAILGVVVYFVYKFFIAPRSK